MSKRIVISCDCCKIQRWFKAGSLIYDEISTAYCDHIEELVKEFDIHDNIKKEYNIEYLCNNCRDKIINSMRNTIKKLRAK